MDTNLDDTKRFIDEFISQEEFTELDSLISGLDISRFSSDKMVVWLSATLAAKDRLPSRAGLVTQCEARLQELGVDRVDELLKRLR